MTGRNYRDLEVWQRSMALAVDVHRLTQRFPKSELFSLTVRLQRSYNIAEGQGRLHPGDFEHHLSMARGSLYEAESQLEMARRLGYVEPVDFERLTQECGDVGRLLNGLIRSVRQRRSTNGEPGH